MLLLATVKFNQIPLSGTRNYKLSKLTSQLV